MIVDYTYSQHDLKKKCYGCKWIFTIDGFNIKCCCSFNRIKNKNRTVLDKACSYKNTDNKSLNREEL